jgi:hypothetical protein
MIRRLLSAIRRGWIFWFAPCEECVRVGHECVGCYRNRNS